MPATGMLPDCQWDPVKLALLDMRISRSDLTALRVFDAVARNRGFAQAQVETGLSLSSISNHVAALEERLGVRLCDRGRSGFKLTLKGQYVLDAARNMFTAMDEFSGAMDSLRERLVGNLRIGIVDAMSTDPVMRLPEALANFKSSATAVTIEIFEDTPNVLQERVRTGDLHLGIGSFAFKSGSIRYQPLYEETHGVFCSDLHPLYGRQAADISPDEVRNWPVVSRGYWRDDILMRLGFTNINATSYQIEPQLILILSGQYLGFLPNHYAEQWTKTGKLRQICPDELQYSCEFDLIQRHSAPKTRVVSRFVAEVLAAHGTG